MAATVRRPGSVTFVIVLTWISALLSLAAGVIYVTQAGDPTFTDPLGATAEEARMAGWIALGMGALTAVVAMMLGSGSRLARFLVTLVMLLRIAAVGYTVATIGGTNALISGGISILFAIIILAMLWNRRATEFFAS